ncbi:MAG TPA: NmrA family NAD(P)-binding protein [bacterium]|nr:NmrA family NAD(P)-binding protein [bacterium]
MKKRVYAIMGASGHIGSAATRRLLENGQAVRAIGRSPEKLKELQARGAELYTASFDDSEALAQAFTGCDGIFTMIPPDMLQADYRAFQNQVGEAIARAIGESGIRQVVNLSSVGGHLPAGTGVVLGLHFQEVRLNALSGVNVVHLRPATFMENLLWQVDLLRSQGIFGEPYKPDLKIAMIATQDIGQRVADLLLSLDFNGSSTQELLGQRDLTMPEVASIVGQAIDKPDLTYVRFTYEDYGAAMAQMGIPQKSIELLNELYRGINEGILEPAEPRSKRNTTPTTIEEFVQTVFLPAYRA